MKDGFEEKHYKVMATAVQVEITVTENGEGTEDRVGIETDQSPAGNEEGDEKGKEELKGTEVLNLGAQKGGAAIT